MALHWRGRSHREFLSAPPCASHKHDFSPASMRWPNIPILREGHRESAGDSTETPRPGLQLDAKMAAQGFRGNPKEERG